MLRNWRFPVSVHDVVDGALRDSDGYVGYLVLGDRASGRAIGITLWQSEDARAASDAKAANLRPEVEQATGGTMRAVEEYEVLYDAKAPIARSWLGAGETGMPRLAPNPATQVLSRNT